MAGDRAVAGDGEPEITLAAIGATAITRRRALIMGAAAGAASLLRARPALARRPARGRARAFGMDVGPGDFDGAVSRVLRAPRRFDVVGVRAADAVRGRLEVRVRRRGGRFSPWVPLAVHGDHAPDTGSGERASDPVWAGGCHELQLRARRGVRGALRLHFVAVPTVARASRPTARAAAGPKQAAPGTPPPIIARDAWGAASVPPRAAPSYGVVTMAFVHHTVTANDYTPEQSASIVLAIAKYHRDTNGWNDIGYNFLVDQYGQVFEGRGGGIDQPVVGAQAQGYNSQSTGVALLGTFTSAAIPEAAMAALTQLLGWKLSVHGVPCEGQLTVISGGGSLNRYPAGRPVALQRISGHRDGDSTSCPGDALYAQLPTVRGRAAALSGPIVPRALITLQTSGGKVLYGDDAVFAGVVSLADASPGSGEAVTIEQRIGGRWVAIAHASTAANGAYVVRLPWHTGGSVRATAAGVTSKVATVNVTPRMSVHRAPRHVRAGRPLRLSGRVRPAVATSVMLELRGRDGRFRRVGSARARVRGTTWRAAVRLRRAGLYRLTPRTSGTGRAPAVFVRAVH
jgi:N-acetylmuramoyl-L-alanine amidase-like protein